MKVIIIDKCNYGKIGEVIDIKAGFANNYLIKQKLAVKDSAKAREMYKNVFQQTNLKKREQDIELNTSANKIKKDSILNIHVNANNKGHLYAALQDVDFIKALESQLGISTNNLKIKLLTVIKELGKQEAEFLINNSKKKIILNIKDDKQAN